MNINLDLIGLINPVYMALILLCGEWIKSLFKPKKALPYVTVTAFVIGIVFYFTSTNESVVINGIVYGKWLPLLVTYFTTTSFYEILVKPLIVLIKGG